MNARKNVFPVKPKYDVKGLKQAASFLKKTIGSKASVSKMNKSQLINFLSDNGYNLGEVATFSKVKVPTKRTKVETFARKNVYPAKPKYALQSLRDATTLLKRALGTKLTVSKMTKSELINYLSDNGYPLGELAKFSKVKVPKPRGRKPKNNVSQVQNKISAMTTGSNMTNDVFSSVLNDIPVKRGRGRPKGSKKVK